MADKFNSGEAVVLINDKLILSNKERYYDMYGVPFTSDKPLPEVGKVYKVHSTIVYEYTRAVFVQTRNGYYHLIGESSLKKYVPAPVEEVPIANSTLSTSIISGTPTPSITGSTPSTSITSSTPASMASGSIISADDLKKFLNRMILNIDSGGAVEEVIDEISNMVDEL